MTNPTAEDTTEPLLDRDTFEIDDVMAEIESNEGDGRDENHRASREFQFWKSVLWRPVCFLVINVIILGALVDTLWHSQELRENEFKNLEKKAVQKEEGWFESDYQSIKEERSWYVLICTISIAFVLLFDAGLIAWSVYRLEQQIDKYCEAVRQLRARIYRDNNGDDGLDEDDDELQLPENISTLGSRFTVKHSLAVATHQLESFLKRNSNVTRRNITKSVLVSVLYLAAALSFMVAMSFGVRYGIIYQSATENGHYCFVNSNVYGYSYSYDFNYLDQCYLNDNLLTPQIKTDLKHLPKAIQEWIEKTVVNNVNGYDYGYTDFINVTASFIKMINDDSFFVGREVGARFRNLMRIEKGGNLTSYSNVPQEVRLGYDMLIDKESRREDGCYDSFCHVFGLRRVLCHEVTDLVPSNLTLRGYFNNATLPYAIHYAEKKGKLLMIMMLPLQEQDVCDVSYSRTFNFFNVTSMELEEEIEVNIENTLTEKEEKIRKRYSERKYSCDSTYFLVSTPISLAFLSLSSLYFRKKGLPIHTVLGCGAGCILLHSAMGTHGDLVLAVSLPLLGLVLLTCFLLGFQPACIDMNKEMVLWLFYTSMCASSVLAVNLKDYEERDAAVTVLILSSVVSFLATYVYLGHPVIQVIGVLVTITSLILVFLFPLFPVFVPGCFIVSILGLGLISLGRSLNKWHASVQFFFYRCLFRPQQRRTETV